MSGAGIPQGKIEVSVDDYVGAIKVQRDSALEEAARQTAIVATLRRQNHDLLKIVSELQQAKAPAARPKKA